MIGTRYMICHWAINRSDPQNLLSVTLDVLLQRMSMSKSRVQETVRRSGVYQHLDRYRLEIVQSTYQRRDEGYTERIWIRKSRHIETYWTRSCTNEFNVTPSLC